MFPKVFDSALDSFNFKDCSFVIQKDRESTGRVVVWKEFNVVNSFTLECSFCGPTAGVYKDCHFTPQTLNDIGRTFCFALLEFTEQDMMAMRQLFQELEQNEQKRIDNNQEQPLDESDSADDEPQTTKAAEGARDSAKAKASIMSSVYPVKGQRITYKKDSLTTQSNQVSQFSYLNLSQALHDTTAGKQNGMRKPLIQQRKGEEITVPLSDDRKNGDASVMQSIALKDAKKD